MGRKPPGPRREQAELKCGESIWPDTPGAQLESNLKPYTWIQGGARSGHVECITCAELFYSCSPVSPPLVF